MSDIETNHPRMSFAFVCFCLVCDVSLRPISWLPRTWHMFVFHVHARNDLVILQVNRYILCSDCNGERGLIRNVDKYRSPFTHGTDAERKRERESKRMCQTKIKKRNRIRQASIFKMKLRSSAQLSFFFIILCPPLLFAYERDIHSKRQCQSEK